MVVLYPCVWHACVCLCRGYVFRAQTQEIKERGGNQSTGIDFYITQERVIFLDTQVRLKHQWLRRFTLSLILYLSIYHSSFSNVIFYANMFLCPMCSSSPFSAPPFWITSSTTTASWLQSTTSLTPMWRCRSVRGQQGALGNRGSKGELLPV